MHICGHSCEYCANVNCIHPQHSWDICIPNPSSNHQPYWPNLVHSKLGFGQTWDWVVVAKYSVIFLFADWMGIPQPHHYNQRPLFIFIVGGIENCTHYWTGSIWIENIQIRILPLNQAPQVVCFHFVFNGISWLFSITSDICTYTFMLLNYMAMWGFSQACIDSMIFVSTVIIISDKSSFCQEHLGVRAGSDGSDGTLNPLTENHTRPITQAMGRIPYWPCGGEGRVSCPCEASRVILPLGCAPLRRHASFTLSPVCSNMYAQSEQHVCYTLRRGSGYTVATYPTSRSVYTFLRPSATLYLSAIAMYPMPQFPHIYVLLCDVVTNYNSVSTSKKSLAIAFALPLSYFTGLRYNVLSSHSLVLCPQSLVLYAQSSKFCIDPSLACEASSSSSASASSPSWPPYPSTSRVPRSNPCVQLWPVVTGWRLG